MNRAEIRRQEKKNKKRIDKVLFGKLNAAFSVRLKQVFCGV